MSMIGNQPGQASQRIADTFNVSSTTSVFTPSSGYTLGYLDVFVNGVKQVNGDDYTASNGTTFTLTSAAVSGDVVECLAYIPRGLSDGYTKSEADAKYPLKPTGTPTGSKFLRDDNSWQTVTAPSPTAVSDQENTSTGYFDLPAGTTAQRPATPSIGASRVNSTTGFLEYYNGSAWISVGSYAIEYIVVAGGGGGGAGYYGGGGGAGGLAYGTTSVSGGSQYGVTVGGGGAGSQYITNQGTSGQNSAFQLTTAIGGGGGGSRVSAGVPSGGNGAGASGGSGGGACTPGSYGGSSTSGQGYAGGNTGSGYGAGGGGAGGVGSDSFNDAYLGAYGGPGSNAYSTWATATSTGVSGYYAGGGGAGTRSGAPTNHYYGGAGGGGNGGVQSGAVPANGTTNTGGGGGGADSGDSSSPGSAHYCGANGGSGIVIIRYAGSQKGSGGTVTTTGGYTYHVFTSSNTFTG